MTRSALRRAATIVAAKGGLISNITVVDCLELELLQGGGMRRTNRGVGLYGVPSGRWKNPHAGDRGRRRVRCAREDLARTKEIRRRKSWIGQRTRERLPALPRWWPASSPRPGPPPSGCIQQRPHPATRTLGQPADTAPGNPRAGLRESVSGHGKSPTVSHTKD